MAHAIPTCEELDAVIADIAAGGDPDQLCPSEVCSGADFSALTLALYQGRADVARWLIDRGASVSAFPGWGLMPLGMAVYQKDPEMVRLLLENGAEPDQRPDAGDYTPLQTAAGYGLSEIASLLLERGADIEARDGSGSTALMLAALNGRMDMVRFLLERGADINARNKENWTALMGAVSKGDEKMARLLLQSGADASLGTRGWQGTPLKFAQCGGDTKTVAVFAEFGL